MRNILKCFFSLCLKNSLKDTGCKYEFFFWLKKPRPNTHFGQGLQSLPVGNEFWGILVSFKEWQIIFIMRLPVSRSLKLSLRKWSLEKHKPDWVISNYHFLQVCTGRLLGTSKNPSGVCSLNKEWVRAELSFSRQISSACSANTFPYRICFKTELGWREIGFVHIKVLHILVRRFKWFPVIILGFVLNMRLLILGCKAFTKPEKYQFFFLYQVSI